MDGPFCELPVSGLLSPSGLEPTAAGRICSAMERPSPEARDAWRGRRFELRPETQREDASEYD